MTRPDAPVRCNGGPVRDTPRSERKLHTSKLAAATASVAALGALGGLAATAPQALAWNNYHAYCTDVYGHNQGCPPNGSTQYEHLQENYATVDNGLANACIDEYLQSGGGGYYYTGQTCTPFGGAAVQSPGGTWGYPRAWNGSLGSFLVWADEFWN